MSPEVGYDSPMNMINETKEKTVKRAVLSYLTDRESHKPSAAAKLRHYFNSRLSRDEESLAGPLIQYMVVGGRLTVVGLDRAASLLTAKFSKQKKLILGNEQLKVNRTELTLTREPCYLTERLYSYSLNTPWFALEEYEEQLYRAGALDLSSLARKQLQKSLEEMGISLEQPLLVKGEFYRQIVYYKERKSICFKGGFMSNMRIPDHLAIGRHSSGGFGVISRRKTQQPGCA